MADAQSTLITGIGELVTNDGDDGTCAALNDAALVISGDRVAWTGPAAQAPAADRVIDRAASDAVLTTEEAVWAATAGGARALRRDDIGHLGVGARADLILLDAPSHAYLAYRPGVPRSPPSGKQGASPPGVRSSSPPGVR